MRTPLELRRPSGVLLTIVISTGMLAACRGVENLVGPTPLSSPIPSVALNESVASASQIVGHHSVTYLGTVSSGDHSTAMWAITENGCQTASTSLLALSAGSRPAAPGGGKGGTNCNSMSHVAFADFVGSVANLRLPGGAPYVTGTTYSTQTNIDACSGLSPPYSCLETVYSQHYGASRPDGPGNWIKYSTISGQTVALAKGFTHIFTVTFNCSYTEGLAEVAIKSGTFVAKQSVPAPRC